MVETEEDPVDVVGVGVRVEKVLEVGDMVEISMATSADTEAVIQAVRVRIAVGVSISAEVEVVIQVLKVGVAIWVAITTALEVVIQVLKVGVAIGMAITRELEVVIQALRVGMDITAKKEILAAFGDKEEIQVLMAGAPRIRTGEVGQEILIKLENKN
jgi:hypothetical protein